MTANFIPPCLVDGHKRSVRSHKQFCLDDCNPCGRAEASNNGSPARRVQNPTVEWRVRLTKASYNTNNGHLPNANKPRTRRTVVPPIKMASLALSLELLHLLASQSLRRVILGGLGAKVCFTPAVGDISRLAWADADNTRTEIHN